MKVIHLLTHLERLDRDLREIRNLQDSLQADRQYSSRLRKSLEDESLRLQNLRRLINSQIIANPPQYMPASPVAAPTKRGAKKGTRPPATTPEPEIVMPGKSPKKKAASRSETPRKANDRGSDRKDKAEDGESDDFNWRFIQSSNK